VRFAAFVPAVLGLIGLPGIPGAGSSQPQVLLVPNVVALGHASAISVSGLHVRTLQVRLVGASENHGAPVPWTSLHLSHGYWRGTLPAPELRGEYPVELRVRPGSHVIHVAGSFLRVFASGTLALPAFRTPELVARWWVKNVPMPRGATLVAMKRWPQPTFDRRDRRLHQLLVLAYSPPGRPAVKDRLGIFITAVRDGYRGDWRLLEATAVP